MRTGSVAGLFFGPLMAAIAFSAPPDPPGDGDIPRTRREFARAISNVQEGMSEAEVTHLLGPPDDVWTEEDQEGILGSRGKIWRYGTSGHVTNATLGQVFLDATGRVQTIVGKGEPVLDDLPEEQELRRLLQVLGEVPSFTAGTRYNPLTVIRAVNLLQPLGKQKSLAVIDEFLRVTHRRDPGREGVYLVLRTLFDVPDDPGYLPTMHVGQPRPSAPANPKRLPRFPIALVGDIPLLVVQGYQSFGGRGSLSPHLAYYHQQGLLRTKLLVPTSTPFQALEAFTHSPAWNFTGSEGWNTPERGRGLLENQVLRLLDSVYRVEPNICGDLLPLRGDEAQVILQEVSKLKIRWDEKMNKYVFSDGTSLPELEPEHYRRTIWRPAVPGLHVSVVVKRRSSRFVSIELMENHDWEEPSPSVVLRAFTSDDTHRVLAKFRIGDRSGRSATFGATETAFLNEGDELTLEVRVDSETVLGPSFRP